MPDTDQTITIADLAEETGLSVRAISDLVTAECHDHGRDNVVHTAASSNRGSLIRAEAADRIRARITRRPV